MQSWVCWLYRMDWGVYSGKNQEMSFFLANCDTVKHLFIYSVLPEIVGKFYTRKPIADSRGIVQAPMISNSPSTSEQTDTVEDLSKLWCYCSQPSFGEMVKFDKEKCTIEWFHFDCLRIRCPPKGKWFCPSCRKLPKFKRKSKKTWILFIKHCFMHSKLLL